MFDLQHPFFKPLWIRILVTVMALGWALMEVLIGSPGWALLFGAMGAWAAWQFFVVWDPAKVAAREAEEKNK